MNFLQEAKEILEVIHSVKEKRSNKKNIMQSTIERKDSRKWSIRESISNNAQIQKTQIKGSGSQGEKQFRITYLRTVIPYLDIESILDLSAVNREFNQFIISIYFYKFISDMRISQKQKRTLQLSKGKKDTKQPSSTSTKKDDLKTSAIPQSGFFSKLTGAFSILTGTTESTPKKEVDPKEFFEKLNLHEQILKEKQKQFIISKDIRDIRDEINKYIDERYQMQMNKLPSSNNNNNKSNQSSIIMTDKEIEMIKKEKLEKESEVRTKEVEKLKKESDQLKKELEKLQREDIETEMLINSLFSYVKNNMDIKTIKEDLAKKDPYLDNNIDYTVSE